MSGTHRRGVPCSGCGWDGGRASRRRRAALGLAVAALAVTWPTSSDPAGYPPAGAAPSGAPGRPPAVVTSADVLEERPGGDRTSSRGNARDRQERPRDDAVGTTSRWVLPLVGRPRVTSCYGYRWGTLHAGVDLDGETGDVVRSVGAGTVVLAGWYGGYGSAVAVDHGDWVTLYGHASRVLTGIGRRVGAGERVALVGSTGQSTGSHLHLEVRRDDLRGEAVEPTRWLRERGVEVAGCV